MKFTRRGFITLHRDGVQISQHTVAEEAYERAFAHASANGPGKYTVRYPDREVDLSTLTRVVLEAAPAGLQAQAVSASAINLTWTANPRATGYRVYRNGTLIGSPTANSFADSGLAASTAYTYTVATVAASGEGPQGAAVQGTTLAAPDTTAPTAPVITATPTGQSTVSVALTTPATDSQSGVASYDLEYKTAAAATYTAITGLAANQFPYVIGSLLPATTYNTRARARDGATPSNIGPYSNVSNATTQTAVGNQESGWTDLDALINSAPYASSRIVYVSTSGNDGTGQVYTPASAALGGVPTNPAGTIAPYATLAAAWAQVRNGFADVMLLRRGDTWTTDLFTNKAGASASARIIVAAYGNTATARPVVRQLWPTTSAGGNQIIAHLEQVITASNTDLPVNGFTLRFEGVRFQGTATGVSPVLLFNTTGGISIVRCGTRKIRNFANNSVGRANLLWHDNTMWHPPDYVGGGGFEHNNYFPADVGDADCRRNISANSPGVGFRLRGLGTLEANLVLNNRVSAAFDVGTTGVNVGAMTVDNRGTYLVHRYNIALHTNGVFQNLNIRNATIEENIVLDNQLFTYSQDLDHPLLLPTTNVILQNNIFRNAQLIGAAGHDNQITGPYLIRNNDFQRPAGGALINAQSNDFTYEANNRFFSSSPQDQWFNGYTGSYSAYVPARGSNTNVSYPAPNRNLITYMQSLGFSPVSAAQAIDWFINGTAGFPGALANRLGAWDDRATAVAVINHVRAGFGKGAIP